MPKSRKWPDINLKSPGIKPRRQHTPSSHHSSNNNSSSSGHGTLPHSSKSHHQLSHEGDHSPTTSSHHPNHNSTSSAQEYSVFANVHLQSGQSHAHLSQSQANLSTVSSTSVADFSDTMSLLGSSVSNSMIAPLLPKRSNSIISLANSTADAKPILSPRASDLQAMAATTTATRHQPVVSPKCLEALTEERVTYKTPSSSDSSPPTISPRTDKYGMHHHHQSSHSVSDASTAAHGDRCPFQNLPHMRNTSLRNSSYNLSSQANQQHQSSVFLHSTTGNASAMPQCNDHHHNHHATEPQTSTVDMAAPLNTPLPHPTHGPIPLSPHVNVPNFHSYRHHLPPPLPPRARRDRCDTDPSAQVRQAPDAPQVSEIYAYFIQVRN